MRKIILPILFLLLSAPSSRADDILPQPQREWAHGTVRDTSGKPLRNAKIHAVALHDAGMNWGTLPASAISDAQGHYTLTGLDKDMLSFTLMAEISDHPPAWSWLPSQAAAKGKSNPSPAPQVDFIIPSQSGSLHIIVLDQEGKPAPSAAAILFQNNFDLGFAGTRGGVSEPEQQMNLRANPSITTGPDGSATLNQLLPGTYNVLAAEDSEKALRFLLEFPWQGPRKNAFFAQSIPIRDGETTNLTLRLIPPLKQLYHFKGMGTDNQPAKGQYYRLRIDPLDNFAKNIRHPELDTRQHDEIPLTSPGLALLSFQLAQDDPGAYLERPPFAAVEGIVAFSNLLPSDYQPIWTARNFNFPSLEVHVVDETGKPIQCTVLLTQAFDPATAGGQTNADGIARFDHVRGDANHDIEATVLPSSVGGLTWTPFHRQEHLPDSAKLPLTGFVPQSAPFLLNGNEKIVLRRAPVSWLRGKITLQKNQNWKDVDLFAQSPGSPDAQVQFDERSGEYLAGPFHGDKATMHVSTDNKPSSRTASQEIKLPSGKIIEADLAAPDEKVAVSPSTPRAAWLTAGGITLGPSDQPAPAAIVLLDDGKTPAFNATVLLFEPDAPRATVIAFTDAAGRIHPRWNPDSGLGTAENLSRGPKVPTLVATLPGSRGAITATLNPVHDGPLKLILPKTLALRGSVTVANTSPASLNATITILAAYQSNSPIAAAMNIQTTVDAKGHFELAGLTPGKYLVQAAIDNIWLSQSFTLEVTDKNPPDLALDIPAPGQSSIIKLVDAAGKPLIGRTLLLDRPKGPLADTLWPAEWVTDGAGIVSIPALEAGKHRIHLKEGDGATEFEVKSLPQKTAVEATLIAK